MQNKNFGIGLGLGYGGTNAKEISYTSKHEVILKKFISLGGTFIDTSPDYGRGASEKLIGKLKKSDREKIFISTKVSPENLKSKFFIRSVKQSLKRLRVKKIHLIQPHWPNHNVKNNEIINAFLKLKSDNIVEKFGLSNFELEDIKYFKKKLKDDFCYIQERFSIGDYELLKKKINYCNKNNIKIICYSPFKTGNIRFNMQQKKILSSLEKKYECNYTCIILAYILAKTKKGLPIPFTTKKKNLKTNLISRNLKICKDDIKILDDKFKVQFIKLKLKDISFIDKNYKKIMNLNDALTVKDLSPSPKELAKKIKNGYRPKHIIVTKQNRKFKIKEGRLRFWANVIAFGWNKKIEFILD